MNKKWFWTVWSKKKCIEPVAMGDFIAKNGGWTEDVFFPHREDTEFVPLARLKVCHTSSHVEFHLRIDDQKTDPHHFPWIFHDFPMISNGFSMISRTNSQRLWTQEFDCTGFLSALDSWASTGPEPWVATVGRPLSSVRVCGKLEGFQWCFHDGSLIIYIYIYMYNVDVYIYIYI